MTQCYYPGCTEHGGTKEHIPPRCFFPEKKSKNLMTVKSCPKHNNSKTTDDIYVLAQICLCILHTENLDVHEVFTESVIPQLLHNEEKLKKMIFRGARNFKTEGSKRTAIPVDIARFNSFFNHLTHGAIFKQFGNRINPQDYFLHHHYPNFVESAQNNLTHSDKKFDFMELLFDKNSPMNDISFKKGRKVNESDIYSIKVIGADSILNRKDENGRIELTSSITVTHTIFGNFRVASLLTRVANFEHSPIYSNAYEMLKD